MNYAEIKALIDQISIPESVVRSDTFQHNMVLLVFEDGEVSCQKAGSLLWQRNLHMFTRGVPSKAIPVELFPNKLGTHGYVFCKDQTSADHLSNLILNHVTPN